MYKIYYTNGYGVTNYIRKTMASLWQKTWNPGIRKWLMRINLTCLIISIAFMQVAFAANAQKISLSKKNASLTEIFKELKKQSGYGFMINKDQISISKYVTINTSGEELLKVLDKCFEGQPLTYKIEGNMIVVIDKEPEDVNANTPLLDVKGKLVDENGKPLAGASINIKGTDSKTVSDENGAFSFTNLDDKAILVISFVGYEAKEVSVKSELGTIKMTISTGKLEEVEVLVSTGYQTLPKERATGSFVQIDNSLFNRKVGSSVIDRLEDVTPGLVFNRNRGASNSISIRGQSTVFSNASPLIVIDNFPYSGNIEDVNPNDVESVTVLKDAAAASIWGAKSGNGVIVITTKKGRLNLPLKINFNSNLTIAEKPDLFYQNRMSSSDFIDVERRLFSTGYYQSFENATARTPLTPVVELLIAERDGKLSKIDANTQIEALKKIDFRNDFAKYFQRNSKLQQYAISLMGGTEKQLYNFSLGYDNTQTSAVGSGNKRLTLNGGNSYYFLNKRAVFSTNIWMTQKSTLDNSMGMTDLALTSSNPYYSIYPYVKFIDDLGNPLSISHNYRSTYLNTLSGLLSWNYNPIEELKQNDNETNNLELRFNTSLKYEIFPGLSANVLYQYGQLNSERQNYFNERAYFTRDLINRFTQLSGDTYSYPVPLGGIIDITNGLSKNQNLRTQLSFNKSWSDQKHTLYAISGYEIQSESFHGNSFRLYGYDKEQATSGKVDYINLYRQFQNLSNSLSIPNNENSTIIHDNYRSYYVNAAYSYSGKYTISGSARLDQSNLFGVKTNQKGVPLWSAGFSWNIDKEDFYNISFLQKLNVKFTYGHTGNVNKAVTAYTTAKYYGSSLSTVNLPYALITNPPNPNLRWERVKIINGSVSFISKRNILSGSLELYRKYGVDLIGDNPIAPSTGLSLFRGNTANTQGTGVDLSLNSININSNFRWTTDFIYSHILDKVTTYSNNANANNYIANADVGGYPLQGKPLYSMYSIRWAGLDPTTGDPQGYLNGNVSKDYTNIVNKTSIADMVYHGSARPTDFGSVRNTFSYKNISVSANISYRFGYYYRESGIDYSNVLKGLGYNYGDYSNRWQSSGDELFTQTPSMPATINTNRDFLYRYSDILVKKGDHIRLQDIALAYTFPKTIKTKWKISNLEFYVYAKNLGTLWKAENGSIDPDYVLADFAPVKTFSAGFRIKL